MKKLIIIAITSVLFISVNQAQSYKIGVKAGLNYFQMNGPLETSGNEEYSLSSGFHFGINFTYYVSDFVGFRGELLYNQKGSRQTFNGDSYSIIKIGTENLYLEGNRDYKMEYSLSYLSLPLVAVVNPTSKIELFGGINLDFLIGPVGSGSYVYTNDDGVLFERSLQHRYNNDVAGEFNSRLEQQGSFIVIDIDDELITARKSIGAYYYYDDEVTGSRFNWFDVGLTAGFAYYINKGLYLGGQFTYGLLDLTQEQYDVSLAELNPDGSFITRDDKDTQFGAQFSLGFRF